MNPRLSSEVSRRGSSWVELLVVGAVLVVGVMMVLPQLTRQKKPAHRIACVNNLKQIGTAFRLFANDWDGLYPHAVLTGVTSTTNPMPGSSFGPFDTNNPANLWRLFQIMGNELSTPRILICPKDTRTAATDFNEGSQLTADSLSHPSRRNQALSYFYGLDARENVPNLLVVGDRNLTDQGTDHAPGKTYLRGIVSLGTNGPANVQPVRWSTGLHDKAGNVGFSDGSVQQMTSGKLREAVVNAGGHTNTTVALPNP